MKIPIFEEIPIEEINAEQLKIMVSSSKIGRVPCYINLSQQKKEKIAEVIITLEQLLLENNLHPAFPYPLYLIVTNDPNSFIPWVHSVKELPEYFFKKVKRPTNKEISLLNKLSIRSDKIRNLGNYKLLNEFKQTALEQKMLFSKTKHLYFLEKLNLKL
jgi:hypothetical protein